jgi:hypothetical protein
MDQLSASGKAQMALLTTARLLGFLIDASLGHRISAKRANHHFCQPGLVKPSNTKAQDQHLD